MAVSEDVSLSEVHRVSDEASGGTMGATDRPEFKVVDFINQVFPNEASLVAVDPLIEKLKLRVRKVDSEILKAVRQQSSSGSQAKEDLAAAMNAIKELSMKMEEIKRKANESEVMVDEICRDIRKLDYAKKHITTTITALNRLGMLVLAVDRLQGLAAQRQYKEAAGQLEAVNQLCIHFEAYKDIPRINELRERVDGIKSMLQSHVFSDFSSLGSEGFREDVQLMRQLSDACLVVDALDASVKEELIQSVCDRELTAYEQIFDGTEVAKLEKAERRYSWIKRQLKANEDVWNIFPVSWKVPYLLCIQFCKITKKQLLAVLENPAEKPSVTTLLEALERTLEFEEDLIDKFSAEDVEGSNPTSKPSFVFNNLISSCFESHLGPYIDLEERQLMDHLDKLVLDETWEAEEGSQTNILGSSSQMFLRIRKSFNRCIQLSRKQTLFNLSKVFSRVLLSYASKLTLRLPKPTQSIVGGADWQVKTTEKEERVICCIINTAEYCHETVAQLAESIQTRIDPEFIPSVNMDEQQEEFSGVITKSLSILVLGFETKLETELQNMAKINWAGLESVGDQSEYVSQISSVLSSSVPQISRLLSSLYFQFFLDKLAASFAPRFYSNIFRCKRISGTGAQQLLLDTHALKTVFLEIPAMAGQPVEANYAKYISREMSKAESLLKVILSPQEGISDTFKDLMPEGTITEFQRILDLKGVKKTDQQAFLEDMGHKVPQGPALDPLPTAPVPAVVPSLVPGVSVVGTGLGLGVSRDAMFARATALGRGAMAQSAAAAAAVSSTGALKRIFALAESAKEGSLKKDMSFRKLFNT